LADGHSNTCLQWRPRAEHQWWKQNDLRNWIAFYIHAPTNLQVLGARPAIIALDENYFRRGIDFGGIKAGLCVQIFLSLEEHISSLGE